MSADTEQGGFYADDQTDADGRYAVTGLAPGQYRIWARGQNQGYIRLHFNSQLFWEDADAISIEDAEEVTGVDFNLSVGATISGRVVDVETGLPIPGMAISADQDRGGAGAYAVTDAWGEFHLPGLATGAYRVWAKPQDNRATAAYVEEYYDEGRTHSDAQLISVQSAEEIVGIDFALQLGGSVAGRVVDAATGLPIPDVDVFADFAEGGYAANTFTDFDGRYTIAGLGTGSYRIGVNAKMLGYIDVYYGSSEQGGLVAIEGSGAVLGIDFNLGIGATISGKVIDADTGLPIADVSVHADFFDGGASAYADTDRAGFYALTGLAPGAYKVSARPQDRMETARYVKEFYDNRLFKGPADLVLVSGTEEISGIDFALDVGATVMGTVTDSATGAPLSGIGVSGELAQGGINFQVRSRRDGTYELTGLAPGLYRVKAEGADQGYTAQFYSGRDRYDDADFLSIGGAEEITGIDFSLGVGGSISGRVWDADTGQPLSGIAVQRDLEEGGAWWDTFTDGDGRYTLTGLGPGRYVVSVEANDRGYIEEYYDGRRGRPGRDVADLVNIIGNATQSDVDFALKRGGNITGRVVDGATGQPIPGIDLRADINGAGYAWTTTDSDGNYTLRAVPDGLIEVIVNGQGYLEQRKTVTLSGAAEVRLDF